MGFLWADLGSWCLDKASDFPARNVHSPRESANHRKEEKEKEGGQRKRETDREREKEKATEVKKKKIKGGSSRRKRNVCGGSVGGERERAGTVREKEQKLGLSDCMCVCLHTDTHAHTRGNPVDVIFCNNIDEQ